MSDPMFDRHMENASKVYADALKDIAETLWPHDVAALMALAGHMQKHNRRVPRNPAPAPQEATL